MVAHDGAESDEIDVAGGSGAEAEIDVFAAVDEFFVEAAEFECGADCVCSEAAAQRLG